MKNKNRTQRNGVSANKADVISEEINMDNAFRLADLLHRQIDAQQQVRDRWFNYYLLITAATIALSTTVLKVFEGSIARNDLYAISAVPLFLTGVIGICFFNLYMRQRRNYLNHYTAFAAVQRAIIVQTLRTSYEKLYPRRLPMERRPKGADYFTLWVQIILVSSYFGIAAALWQAAIWGGGYFSYAAGGSVAILAAIVLEVIRDRFEKG